MFSLSLFRELVDYTYWGRDRILKAAEGLTPEQLKAKTWLDHESIQSTLLHQMASEILMRERWEGANPTRLLDERDIQTYEALKERWLQQEAAVRRFVDGLSEADLIRPVEYTSRAGVAYSDPLWQVLFQNVNHGTQHRSEVALALTQVGHSPGFLDYLAYARERYVG
jgi:uncharacterized damage-inducible protein DinB